MRTFRVLCILFVMSMFITTCHKAKPVDTTIAFQQRDSVWSDFRDEFRYHMQVVGQTAINEDKSVMLLISEPPPHVNLADLKHVLKKFTYLIETKTNKIGYDGWVKDLVITISEIDKDDLADLIKDLNTYLYFTSYKSYAIDLPVKNRKNNYLADLNYKIRVSELNKWFFTDEAKFYSAEDSTETFTLQHALEYNKFGLLYSKEPGFVIWILSGGQDISAKSETIRMFCVDADLILGAVHNSNGNLAIIGRERVNNLYDLPPLRTETIQLLAAADKTQISQSYERTALFAGKISNGKDWAPIYLSPDLINSEYGSLLNITDQMLKSWSSNGNIEYTGFNYTRPSYYPYEETIQERINSEALTFNWNTKGVGYTVQNGDNEFYCLNRTGALPVTYIPEGMQIPEGGVVEQCEKKAYDYYSWLGNPDLARVVQYAAIYQIFSRYQVTSTLPSYPVSEEVDPSDNSMDSMAAQPSIGYSALAKYATDVLIKIKTANEDELTQIADHAVQQQVAAEDRLLKDKANIPPALMDAFNVYRKELQAESQRAIIDTLRQIQSDLGPYDGSEATLAEIMTNSRDTRVTDEQTYYDAMMLSKKLSLNKLWQNIVPAVTIDQIKDEYVESKSTQFVRWIKTPSIVVSWDSKDSIFAEGGHNLDARVTPFKVSAEIPKGEIKIIEANGGKEILINEADVANIDPSLLRKIATEGEEVPDHLYLTSDNYTPRAINDVFPVVEKRTTRGLSDNHIHVAETTGGFIVNGKKVNDCNELINELTTLAYHNDFENLRVHFERIDENRARALVKSSEIKMAGTELNATRYMHSGEIFNINRTRYDFARAKVISDIRENEVVIEIPRLERPTSRARVTIKGFFMETKKRILSSVNKLLGRASGDDDINFYGHLIEELKEYHIKPEDVSIEVDDCIICANPFNIFNGDC